MNITIIKNISHNLAEILDLLDAFETGFELVLSDDDSSETFYEMIFTKEQFVSSWNNLCDTYESSLSEGLCPVIYIDAKYLLVDMCTIDDKLDFGFKRFNHKGDIIDRFMINFKDIKGFAGVIEKQPYPPDADFRNLIANYLS